MIRGGLFHRLFLRFLAVFAVALILLLPIVHQAQRRMLRAWHTDILGQAEWLVERLAPERDAAALSAEWERTHGTLGARPGAFPSGFTAEVAVVLVLVLGLVVVALYPFVRSLGAAFSRMTEVVGDVAAGSYGRTVGIERRDELGGLIRAFDEMSLRLAEADRLQARLLHDVSHELRSPLGRIQALAETIERHPEDARSCVEGIEREVALLDRLVGDLLTTAHLESAAVTPTFEEISLREWAGETFERLAPRARARGIAWSTRLPETDRRIRADPQRLTQAVANLVDNAVAALDGQRDGAIDLRVEAGETSWALTVSDDGSGIPPEDLPHVSRRFYRVGEHRGRDSGGFGLGLSLVRAIAEAHGGEVTIESRIGDGSGTTVTLRMPAAGPETE